MKLPVTIIDKYYSDAYMQPENMDHPHSGITVRADSVLRADDLSDSNESIDLQASVSTNELAMEAHKEAAAVYASLTKEERQGTDPASLAIKLFNQKVRARQRLVPTTDNLKSGKMQIMTTDDRDRTTQRKIRLAAERAAETATSRPRKKKRSPKSPSKFSVTAAKKSVRKPSSDVTWLGIPDLGTKPQRPDVRVRLSWRDTQQDAIRNVDFSVHWATAVESENGNGFSIVNFIVDTRDQESMERRPRIEDDPDAEMTVVFQVEDAKYELTAIKTTLQHSFGIFHFIQVMALNDG